VSQLPSLTAEQAVVVGGWLPGARLVADHSWNLVDRAVLQIRNDGSDVLVKAGGRLDHHADREITAYERFVGALAARGRAPRLLKADRDLRLLAGTYLPGVLVEGRAQGWQPETYRQAGRLLAVLHSQGSRTDTGFESRQDRKALAWLDRPHRIAAHVAERIRAELSTAPPGVPRLVPTHGDWHPRNWLVHEGQVSAIDFGRAGWRPAESDLARLAARQWRGRPDLEHAFLEGYGKDPRTGPTWRRTRLREAVGTAVWAHLVGDAPFEEQGHRMIADVLDG
jgi:aminoglycoside/choline kinase family phosphotransferase